MKCMEPFNVNYNLNKVWTDTHLVLFCYGTISRRWNNCMCFASSAKQSTNHSQRAPSFHWESLSDPGLNGKNTHTYTNTHTHKHTHTYKHTHTHTNTHTYKHTHTRKHTRTMQILIFLPGFYSCCGQKYKTATEVSIKACSMWCFTGN